MNLKQIVAGLEDGIIILSGPALAISGIIAGVDLVTGGHILTQVPLLTMAWAITLLLTLDFQVLCLGVRAHRVYARQKSGWVKLGEIALMVAIAAAISFVSIQMQSIIARVNAEQVTIDMAAAQLGVNMIALTWERSTLVLVLIFLSGWLREEGKQALDAPARPNITIVEQAPTNRQIEAPDNLKQIDEQPTDELPIYTGQFTSKEPAIRAALERNPDASPEAIAQEAGASLRTTQRWLDKIRSEQA